MANIKVLEERVTLMFEQNAKDHKLILDEVAGIRTIIEEFKHECDKRYASKTTEVIVYGMVGIILASVLYAILHTVFKVTL